MKTYDKIYALGHDENANIFDNDEDEIVVEEKVDGANFRFTIEHGELRFGSRTQTIQEDQCNKNFKRAVEFVRDKFNGLSFEEKRSMQGLTFFCENMVKHTIPYNWDITPPVIGYDIYASIYLEGKGVYMSSDKCKELFDMIGIEFVPIVKKCTAKECKEILKTLEEYVPTSKYVAMKAEGIVFKNYTKQMMAKYVRQEFKERNEEVFGKTKKKASNDEEWMTAVYCNNHKVEKIILKQLDLGEKLSMELMHKIPNEVYNDIFAENWQEIIKLDKTINFKRFKGFVSKRCCEVLKQFMMNRILNDDLKGGKNV